MRLKIIRDECTIWRLLEELCHKKSFIYCSGRRSELEIARSSARFLVRIRRFSKETVGISPAGTSRIKQTICLVCCCKKRRFFKLEQMQGGVILNLSTRFRLAKQAFSRFNGINIQSDSFLSIFNQQKTFPVCIAWYKHEWGWENSRQFYKP